MNITKSRLPSSCGAIISSWSLSKSEKASRYWRISSEVLAIVLSFNVRNQIFKKQKEQLIQIRFFSQN